MAIAGIGGIKLSKGLVDISVLGDKELSARLAKMHPRLQRKVARQALKKSAKRIKPLLVQAVSGNPIKVQTGRLLLGMTQVKIVPLKRSRVRLGFGIPLPERETLGIPADTPDKKQGYYPYALEYGTSRIPPKRWIRDTVNRAQGGENRQIARDIAKGIEREWKKGAKFVATGKK